MITKMTDIDHFIDGSDSIDGVGGIRQPVASDCVTTRFTLRAA